MKDAPALTTYTCSVSAEQATALRSLLEARGYEMRKVPHGHFGAAGENVSVSAYLSGKLVVQGKGTRDFVQFILEPEVLKEVRLGYEEILTEPSEARIGIDESGKGDYFGPLVIAGVFVTPDLEKTLRAAGVKDSKLLSDARAKELRRLIKKTCVHSVVAVGPERYNQLYPTMGNLNRILAWGHARVIENILTKVNCRKAVLDQFGHKDLVLGALMKKGRNIEVSQRHRGEEDLAVAAGSVLARAEFLIRLEKLAEEMKVELPKGNGKAHIIPAARKIVAKLGLEALVKVAKVHFKTTREVMLG